MDFARRKMGKPPTLGNMPAATPAIPDSSNDDPASYFGDYRSSQPQSSPAPAFTPFSGPPTIQASQTLNENSGFAAALSGQGASYLSPVPLGIPSSSGRMRDATSKPKRPSGLSAHSQPPSSPASKSNAESPALDMRSLSFEGRADSPQQQPFSASPLSIPSIPKTQNQIKNSTSSADSAFKLKAPLPMNLPSKRTLPPSKACSAPQLSQSRNKNARIAADKFAVMPKADLDSLLSQADSDSSVLIVDIRPHTKFMSSEHGHLRNSISLCAPTTLLRRAAFGLDRLADTLPDNEEKERFLSPIAANTAVRVVLGVDQDSTALFDDSPLCSLLTKFEKAGFAGKLQWVQGGYQSLQLDEEFMAKHRQTAEEEESSGSSSFSSSPNSSSPTSNLLGPSRSGSGGSSTSASSVRSSSNMSRKGSDTGSNSGSVVQVRLLPGQAFDSRSTQAHILDQGQSNKGFQQQCANPFFDTIRQNHEVLSLESSMNNVVDVHLNPQLETPKFVQQLPPCLRSLAELNPRQRGEKLAHEFYLVEAAEQKRLQDMLGRAAVCKPANEPEHPFGISAAMEKGHLNRYKNIFPYEHSRCHLKTYATGATDYINASHIYFKDNPSKRYIASQGPLPSTYEDFYQLVDQENVGVVVMLTNLMEGGREKCGKYYLPGQYGRFNVSCKDGAVHQYPGEDQAPQQSGTSSGFFSSFDLATAQQKTPKAANSPSAAVCRSTLTISRSDGSEKAMKHIKFAGWPDFDVPPDAEALLDLIAEVNQARADIARFNGTEEGPVLVHCSAGVGRTGSYMLIDVLLDMYEQARKQHSELQHSSSDMDIDASPSSANLASLHQPDYLRQIVDEMRQNRMSMVANYAQYQFCTEAILKGCKRIIAQA